MKIVYDGTLDPRQCKAVLGELIPAMAADGSSFTRSANGVWLVDAVGPRFLAVEQG